MEIIEGKMPFMGYETYYRIVGKRSEKPPLILLHGGPGSTRRAFRGLGAPLPARAEHGIRIQTRINNAMRFISIGIGNTLRQK